MSKDFRASQIETSKLIASGGISGTTVGLAIYSGSIASNREGGLKAPHNSTIFSGVGSDVFLFVSGSKNLSSFNRENVTLFGGDIVVSGTLYAERQVIEVDGQVDGDMIVTGSLFVEPDANAPNSVVFRQADGTNIFVVDSSTPMIQITGSVEQTGDLSLLADARLRFNNPGENDQYIYGTNSHVMLDVDNYFYVDYDINTQFRRGGTEQLEIGLYGAIFNDTGAASNDFRVESDTLQGAILVDGGDNTVVLGSNVTTFAGLPNEAKGSDVNLVLSGTSGTKGTSTRGVIAVSGDLVVSGTTFHENNVQITGSLQQTGDLSLLANSYLRFNNPGQNDQYIQGNNSTLTIESDDTLDIYSDTMTKFNAGTGGVNVIKFALVRSDFNDNQEDVDFSVSTANNDGTLFVDAADDSIILGYENFNYSLESGDKFASDVSGYGNDVKIMLSGSSGTKGTSNRGVVLMPGDVVISGSLYGGSPLKVSSDIGLTGSMRFKEQSAPNASANEAVLYAKEDIDGTTKLFFKGSNNSEIGPLGSGGSLDDAYDTPTGGGTKSSGAGKLVTVDGGPVDLRAASAATKALSVTGSIIHSGSYYSTADVDIEGAIRLIACSSIVFDSGGSSNVTAAAADSNTLQIDAPLIKFNALSLTPAADTNFFVSGSMGSKDSSTRGTAVFGGDLVVSGTIQQDLNQLILNADHEANINTSNTPFLIRAKNNAMMLSASLAFNRFVITNDRDAGSSDIILNSRGNVVIRNHSGVNDSNEFGAAGQATLIFSDVSNANLDSQTILDGASAGSATKKAFIQKDASNNLNIVCSNDLMLQISNSGQAKNILLQTNDVAGSDVIINDDGLTNPDFRVESNTLQGAILVDGADDTIVLGSNATTFAGLPDAAKGTDVAIVLSSSIGSKDTSTRGVVLIPGDAMISGSLDINTVTVTSDGKIGIGDPSPSYKLEVGGNAAFGEYLYHRNDSDTFIQFPTTEDKILLNAGGKNMLSLTEAGANTQVLILSGGASTSINAADFNDTNFFVSGSIGSRNTSNKGTAVFGGDVVISGTLHGGSPLKIAGGMEITGSLTMEEGSKIVFPSGAGLTGSLQEVSDGVPYLLAGTNISLLTSSNGQVTITSTGVAAGAGGSNTQVIFNNGGAQAGDSNFTFNSSTDTLTVTNMSGSLTQLSNGTPYIIPGSNVSTSTGSNGAITISSTDTTFTAGDGITLTGTEFSIVNATNGGVFVDTNTISLNLANLAEADVAVASDSIAIIDATDFSTKRETVADLIDATAGSGLNATSGVLSVNDSIVATISGSTFTGDVKLGNLTLDSGGNEIDVSSGDLTLDVAGNIELNADGGTIDFKDETESLMQLTDSGITFDDDTVIQATDGNLSFKATGINHDIIFAVDDAGVDVDPVLTIDGSNNGSLLHTPRNSGYLEVNDADTDGLSRLYGFGYLSFERYSDTATTAGVLGFRRSRGADGSQSAVQSGDYLGQIKFEGYDTSFVATAAEIRAVASADHGSSGDSTDSPGQLEFYTTPDGTSTSTLAMTINSDQTIDLADNLTIGGDSDGSDRLITFGHSTLKSVIGIDDSQDVFAINTDASFETDNDLAIDTNGNVMMPNTCFVSAQLSASETNIAINTTTDVVFNTEHFDNKNAYDNTTGVFTAPVDGYYLVTVRLQLESIDTAASEYRVTVTGGDSTVKPQYMYHQFDPNFSSDTSSISQWSIGGTSMHYMDSGDTIKVTIYQSGGTQQTDIDGSATEGIGSILQIRLLG